MSVSDILDALPGNGQAQQLIQLGCIKIGGKSKTARESRGGGTWYAPEKYDSFHLTTMNRTGTGHLIEDDALMSQLITKNGDKDGKLRAIPIRLLSDDIDDVLQSAICWYGKKTVGARSDGKTVKWFYDPKTMSRIDPPLEEPWKPEFLEWTNAKGVKLFKPHSIFSCVIAAESARWGGVYKFRTTSVISLRQLHASLVHLHQLTGGILVGMPLMLVLRPIQVAPEGKATTVYVVHVELRGGDLRELQTQAMEMSKFRLTFANQIQSTTRQYQKLLTGPGMESDDEAADIADEFSPDEDPGEDLPTVPTNKPFGLLDGPTPPVTANEESKPPASEPPSEMESDDIPGEVIPPKRNYTRWPHFSAAMEELASAQEVPPSVYEAAMGVFKMLPTNKWPELVEAARAVKLDWAKRAING